ncbi:hypothetical protein COT97_05160 [Candidatus Falkowbacteria bacterium CG10_big_fil_rev_8_21_14_0_10_39_11]|uniref:ATP-grasp domain-containing protein n=1 Tax=Candidatus Falkowbacteria bacterium CG10_big_fil_rev_8_21_14_0_10_39_11 TaxID=1974565 RepID=A0A2H0V3Q5_9BACT|nr:MAG: hypothetical protein COT97_05160 [Candidatus Falkowbacteria bacterium CG10_big_fil_rev_8_21_14_0_10_39_11]
MRILLIGPKSKENEILVSETVKRGHAIKRLSIQQITYLLKDNEFEIYNGQESLDDYDVCLIRGINPFFAKAKTLAKALYRKGVKVVDRELYQKVYIFDKLFMYSALSYHELPCLDTFYYPSVKAFKKFGGNIEYPVLLKDINGMHGRNIFFKNTENELEDFFNWRKINNYFIQKFVPAEYYYRVLVVGNKVLGAMKRNTLSSIRKKRIPLEKRSHKSELTMELKRLALKAAKATNTDIAGVDIIYDGDKPYVLEVNRSPQFKRFTQVVGVNVAGEIIDYLEKIYKSN